MKINQLNKTIKRTLGALSLAFATSLSLTTQATIVQFETVLGNFEVNLYDDMTPETVANFLAYVDAEDYNNAIFHRSVANFVIQGGGFAYNNEWPVSTIAANAPVINEARASNVYGTIAMAKVANNPDSATNQWFINVADNSANLDYQNGGFTVFGEVMGDGMQIVEQIATLPRFNLGGALAELPLQNYDGTGDPNGDHLVIITRIRVIDEATDTAANANPLLIQPPEGPDDVASSSGGSGSFNFVLLTLMALAGLGRKK